MADHVKVSIEELEAALGSFNTARTNAEQAIAHMSSTVAGLSASWTGSAAEAYEARFHELKTHLNSCEPAIGEAVAFLQKEIAGHVETAAQTAASIPDRPKAVNPFTA